LVDASHGGHELHEVPAAAEGGQRQASPYDLPQDRYVGLKAEHFLGASQANPEAGDDFVADKKSPVFPAQIADPFQKPRLRVHQAHVPGNGLYYDGGRVLASLIKELSESFEIVAGAGHGEGGQLFGDPKAAGKRKSGQARSGSRE
jgi:hypothetical protein